MNDRDCYCDLLRATPEWLSERGIPEGYCGLCEVCGAPGHTRHYPGAVPYTGTWCDRCFGASPSSRLAIWTIRAAAAGLVLLLWRACAS